MNILFLQREYSPCSGGVQRVSKILSDYFEKQGFGCFFLFLDNIDSCSLNIDPSRYKVITKQNYENVVSFVIDNNINVIINQHQYCPFLIKFYKIVKAKSQHVSIINVFHNTPDDFLHYLNPFVYRAKDVIKRLLCLKTRRQLISDMYHVVDKMVLLSPSYKKLFMKYYKGEDGRKLYAIPNPLTFEIDSSEVNFEKKEKVVLVAARLASQKNLFSLLRIWKLIEENIKDWTLVIAGSGEDEIKLKKYKHDLNLNNVIFKGQVNNVKPLFMQSSILALTSTFEGFPMSVLEAMQMGNPVIAFDTFNAIQDINRHKQCIVSIRPFNEKKYAEKLMQLMLDDALRLVMAHNALEVSSEYRIDKIGKLWKQLFSELNSVR